MQTVNQIVKTLMSLIAEDQALRDAGAKRDDPATWRPDLIKPMQWHATANKTRSASCNGDR